MIIARTINELQQALANKGKIAFVPTMGCLHDGHLSLIKRGQEVADCVVVSIYVNQAQFNQASDFDNYPRDENADFDQLRAVNTDVVFVPQASEMEAVILPFAIPQVKLDKSLCGSTRPGHFDGVAMVISKFFDIIKPDFAVFGQKDFQQVVVVKDLGFDVQIIAGDSFRQDDGLVHSSRNERLSKAGLKKATLIYKTLLAIKDEVKDNPNQIDRVLKEKSQILLKNGFDKIDYLEIRTSNGLELVRVFDENVPSRIFIAIFLEGVRLIDNIELV